MFAPRNPGEFHRVLRPNGSLIVVRPTVDHLAELRRDVPDSVTIDVSRSNACMTPRHRSSNRSEINTSATSQRLNRKRLAICSE